MPGDAATRAVTWQALRVRYDGVLHLHHGPVLHGSEQLVAGLLASIAQHGIDTDDDGVRLAITLTMRLAERETRNVNLRMTSAALVRELAPPL